MTPTITFASARHLLRREGMAAGRGATTATKVTTMSGVANAYAVAHTAKGAAMQAAYVL
jgi:hypothetical protein